MVVVVVVVVVVDKDKSPACALKEQESIGCAEPEAHTLDIEPF